MRGLTVQSTALDALLNVLDRERTSHKDDNEVLLLAIIDEVKERMVQGISQTNNNNSIVTASLLGEVVANLSRSGRDAYDESVQLLDAFRTPRLCFDPMRKNFELVLDKASSLHGEAIDKVCIDIISLNVHVTCRKQYVQCTPALSSLNPHIPPLDKNDTR
jgi:hypothetical protein